MKDDILVSINCIAYNNAKYIRQTLDGFLNQKTNFSFEVVIHDDASSDGTTEIIHEYEENYPDIIKAFYEKKNTFSEGRLNDVLRDIHKKHDRGKYIAMCEGDDLWIDRNKLQIQVDYMEKHPECSMSGHNTLKLNLKNGEAEALNGVESDRDVTIEEIIKNKNWVFHTSSFVFKKEILELFYEALGDNEVGDWPLRLLAITCGSVHYFDKIMSLYRMYVDGSWTDTVLKHEVYSYAKAHLPLMRFLQRYNAYTSYMQNDLINDQIDECLTYISFQTQKLNGDDFESFCKDILKANDDNYEFVQSIAKRRKVFLDEEKRQREFANKYRYVYIMGAGLYGEILANRMRNMGLDFEGFLVSNNQPLAEKYCGKKVVHLKSVSKNSDEVGIFIAISKSKKEEIEQSLADNGINNYFWTT